MSEIVVNILAIFGALSLAAIIILAIAIKLGIAKTSIKKDDKDND
jgi:hypothetical protein